ncbi:hypothetical protein GCM10010211_22540 [Streptomyces albospinus]|uniref:Uncharacterized protein n=1 Tax=Streptomyces albospinus TaxID=285515 RepID=A0ABQ2UZB9_9ACTN|nr:hypothetical protein GCM10010211_22540 [Streptomyces albospinus]
MPLLLGAAEALRRAGHQVHPYAGRLGGLRDEPDVLARRGHREARREVPGQDHLRLHLQIRHVERPAGDRGQEVPRVDAEPLGERQSLTRAADDRQHPGVDDELEAAGGPAGTVLADPVSAAADDVEDPPRALPQLLRTGCQDGQLPFFGGCLGSHHRGVDEPQVVFGGEPGERDERFGSYGAHLEPEGAGGEPRSGPPQGVQDGGSVEQHGEDDIGAVHRLRRGVGDAGPVGGQWLGLGAGAVPGADVQPGAGEIAGHGGTHDPGAEYGD